MGDAVMPDLSAKIDAVGAFLIRTHQHEPRPDLGRPGLRRAPEPREACRTLRWALELESVPVETAR
jgi:hypothetical protein